jgi:methylaspartate mutase sigma subunit
MAMKIVIGVIGNDIHVVANRLIEISLKERGFQVFNLGVNTYLEEF